MRTYGQYCPIARGAEVFAERWTPLIVRNLHLGCGSFCEILQGAPGLSRTLLAQRLKQLERLGVVESSAKPDGRGRRYQLTSAGAAHCARENVRAVLPDRPWGGDLR